MWCLGVSSTNYLSIFNNCSQWNLERLNFFVKKFLYISFICDGVINQGNHLYRKVHNPNEVYLHIFVCLSGSVFDFVSLTFGPLEMDPLFKRVDPLHVRSDYSSLLRPLLFTMTFSCVHGNVEVHSRIKFFHISSIQRTKPTIKVPTQVKTYTYMKHHTSSKS